MPLWKVYTPVGAYSDADKAEFVAKITEAYGTVPIPAFYVVVIFEEVAANNIFVGGKPHPKFVRFKIDQMARTANGAVVRSWWVQTIDSFIAPWVKDRGFDWEVTVDELPADLWSIQGQIPPPFESVAEKRWIAENKVSPYSCHETIPASGRIWNAGVAGS
jgi:phenylpyruvate tautomerase PptA (4-oxalocrotonate tautomerase family)